jgi:hypothetical protein
MADRAQAGARKLLAGLLALIVNCGLFLAAFFVGLRLVYAGLFRILDLGRVGPGIQPLISERQAMTLSISVAFVLFAALASVWTRSLLSIVVPSAAMFVVGMTAVGWAMYLADGGDSAIAWKYIAPRAAEYFGALFAAAIAGLGWYGATRVRQRRVPSDGA